MDFALLTCQKPTLGAPSKKRVYIVACVSEMVIHQ